MSSIEDLKKGMGNGERDNAVATHPDIVAVAPWSTLPPGAATQATRTFATGATRDTEHGKLDYEGFLSPLVLERFAEYMDKHRVQADGSLRSSDNWQKGIPDSAYMKSLWRHFMDAWKAYRDMEDMEEALCAMLFNTMGLLHESVRGRGITEKG